MGPVRHRFSRDGFWGTLVRLFCGVAGIVLATCSAVASAGGPKLVPRSAGVPSGAVHGVVVRSPVPARAAPAVVGARVLYLDFSDGTESITTGPDDDATRNQSAIGARSPYPSFAPTLAAATRDPLVRKVVAGVHQAFAPYNLQIATARPAQGPYTTVMIGGDPGVFGFESAVAGVAVLDCADDNPSNLVFVFPDALRTRVEGLIATIAQEAAHSYGLEHTTNPGDFMYPRVSATQESFPDVDGMLAGAPNCGSASQNSHRKLLSVLGAWPGGPKTLVDGTQVDVTAPRLRFVSPVLGESVSDPVTVVVEASDDLALERIELVAGEHRTTLRTPPFEWRLPNPSVGPVAVAATAHDAWGNQTGATLTFDVVAAPHAGGCAFGAGPDDRSRRGGWAEPLWVVFALATCRQGKRRL